MRWYSVLHWKDYWHPTSKIRLIKGVLRNSWKTIRVTRRFAKFLKNDSSNQWPRNIMRAKRVTAPSLRKLSMEKLRERKRERLTKKFWLRKDPRKYDFHSFKKWLCKFSMGYENLTLHRQLLIYQREQVFIFRPINYFIASRTTWAITAQIRTVMWLVIAFSPHPTLWWNLLSGGFH